MNNQLSVWFIPVGYDYSAGFGLGLGARYQWVVVPQGFIRFTNGMRDEFGIEAGIDYIHDSPPNDLGWSYNEVDFVAGATWNFWILPNLCVYPKIDIGVGTGSFSTNAGVVAPGGYGGFFIDFEPGVAYRVADKVLLRAEVGTRELRLGVGFKF
jgi:hypothetical protein